MRAVASAVYEAGWEARRAAYARGWLRPERVAARVVSIGNLSVGGTGKTTLTLHLAARARSLGIEHAIVARDYRPGPAGLGDETLLYRAACGESRVFSGRSKRLLAHRAAASGNRLVLVDDGFSHWRLKRDLDVVLLDARESLGREHLLPAGRLREPWRALQRAGVVVLTRAPRDLDVARVVEAARAWAPAAHFAVARHAALGIRLGGQSLPSGRRVRVLTATGNPNAVAETARELGFEVTALSTRPDHHWFTPRDAAAEQDAAEREGAVLCLTAKDAVRWPLDREAIGVVEVTWQWVSGGEQAERRVFEAESS
ncbi:MAG: tetraacyldisaccharide 4'-kinase [Candidatus Eisenbacteria bacterium]|uniref:Tetraacyldisaccharide 4'-kinase n=1 Tax=Eiseniibacteriota bacterium TaxID=2212470 RepID=A0A849SHL6_UNCEI|nr:tetraacyldisaccharide 4'-kinase [Candidatus Eisenbacteria bacterium]